MDSRRVGLSAENDSPIRFVHGIASDYMFMDFLKSRHAHSSAVLLLLSVAAFAQQNAAPIVQPGAPGKDSKTLSPASIAPAPRAASIADISFMQGMIMHHSQAVDMTALMATRTRNKALLELGKRISISQTDEMKYMKQWLEDRGQPITMERHMDSMAGSMAMGPMDHMNPPMNMNPAPMLMPGMLTPEQMKALAAAKDAKFDHLFLTGMIQHHGGALTMVQDLFDTPGAGQDNVLFDFATDIDNTQRAEIEIMKGMLLKEKK